MQDEISTIRERINLLDEQLVQLLNERATAVLEVGKAQKRMGTKKYDPDRERAILERIDALNKGPLNKGAIEELFATIMTVCREIQSR